MMRKFCIFTFYVCKKSFKTSSSLGNENNKNRLICNSRVFRLEGKGKSRRGFRPTIKLAIMRISSRRCSVKARCVWLDTSKHRALKRNIASYMY